MAPPGFESPFDFEWFQVRVDNVRNIMKNPSAFWAAFKSIRSRYHPLTGSSLDPCSQYDIFGSNEVVVPFGMVSKAHFRGQQD
ncbi:hypothetical protein EYZ11_012052 [Aspergillus tanneri]|uniref:Uncharacterized protein n=1 Tax=Aspergillus tanneri TaxID=1220188 RepID=A0A4S3J179_9EURO|nr:hypothetical protein EYZ11_012052 [Aspergillus tanneri]